MAVRLDPFQNIVNVSGGGNAPEMQWLPFQWNPQTVDDPVYYIPWTREAALAAEQDGTATIHRAYITIESATLLSTLISHAASGYNGVGVFWGEAWENARGLRYSWSIPPYGSGSYTYWFDLGYYMIDDATI